MLMHQNPRLVKLTQSGWVQIIFAGSSNGGRRPEAVGVLGVKDMIVIQFYVKMCKKKLQ